MSVGLLVFHYSPRLLDRYGAKNLILVAHAGHFARVLLYTLLTKDNCTFALPIIETLHCFSFALFWAAASHMLHNVCATGNVVLVSNQSLLSLSHMTIGQGLGSYVWMQVYGKYGIGSAIAGGLVVTIISAVILSTFISPTTTTTTTASARATETLSKDTGV